MAEKDTVVDVNLKHVLFAFGGFTLAALSVGVSIILLRDYSKYKRQKAIIEAATHLILIIKNEGSTEWTKPKQKTDIQSVLPIKK